jgi:hypothetical protein
MTDDRRPDTTELRFLEARNVRYPSGTLADLTVRTCDDEKLGEIAGVLLDPTSRRVRYFVVETTTLLRRRRYLLPADTSLTVLDEDKLLRVDARAADLDREQFDAASVRRFSDEDAITAMFSSSAA